MIRLPLSLLSVLALAACGGGGPVDTGPPPDVKLDQANKAGTQALSMDLPSLAVRQYKVALSRAYERDDAGAIGDVAYNLALAQMKAGDSKGAVATVRETRAELDRRRAAVPPELILVQAAASYRSGDLGAAAGAAQEVLDRGAKDPDVVRRAWFIRGLVAADRSDAAGLAQAIAALPPTKQADLEADRQELQGRAALLANDSAGALSLFEQSASNRQQALDYRGMARALSLAGDAALRSGRAADAADLFLRAGRSALLQGDTATATPLLKRAEDLGKQTGQTGIVEEVTRLRKVAAAQTTKTYVPSEAEVRDGGVRPCYDPDGHRPIENDGEEMTRPHGRRPLGDDCVAGIVRDRRFRVVGRDQDRRPAGRKGDGDIVGGSVVAAAGLVADPPVRRQAGAQAAGARLAGEQPADQAIAR